MFPLCISSPRCSGPSRKPPFGSVSHTEQSNPRMRGLLPQTGGGSRRRNTERKSGFHHGTVQCAGLHLAVDLCHCIVQSNQAILYGMHLGGILRAHGRGHGASVEHQIHRSVVMLCGAGEQGQQECHHQDQRCKNCSSRIPNMLSGPLVTQEQSCFCEDCGSCHGESPPSVSQEQGRSSGTKASGSASCA